MAGYRSAAGGEPDNVFIVVRLIIYSLSVAVCGSDDLPYQPAFVVINIAYCIYSVLRDNYIISEYYIIFNSTGDLAFLVSIIILLFCMYVNRPDYISLAVVDIKNSAPVSKCGEKLYLNVYCLLSVLTRLSSKLSIIKCI